jgi:hypothetical protein
MAKIYENAFVTISADAAMDSTSGFLDYPARSLGRHANIEGKTRAGQNYTIHVRDKGRLAADLPFHAFYDDLQPGLARNAESEVYFAKSETKIQSKLATRGWVGLENDLLNICSRSFNNIPLGFPRATPLSKNASLFRLGSSV